MANPFEKQKYKNKNRLWFHVNITSRDDPEMWARAANAGVKGGGARFCLRLPFLLSFPCGKKKVASDL